MESEEQHQTPAHKRSNRSLNCVKESGGNLAFIPASHRDKNRIMCNSGRLYPGKDQTRLSRDCLRTPIGCNENPNRHEKNALLTQVTQKLSTQNTLDTKVDNNNDTTTTDSLPR